MSYDSLAKLRVRVESYDLSGLELPVSPAFQRRTTLVRLAGSGHAGVGEEVTYEAPDQRAFLTAGACLDLAGEFTLGELWERIAACDLYPSGPPTRAESRPYRRWAFESAALDLALRQARTTFASAVGLEPRPLRFVASLALGAEPSTAPLRRLLECDPALRFKLDWSPEWAPALVAELAELGVVDVVDFKGAYVGTPVDTPFDAAGYARVAEAFPEAWLEDPAPTSAAITALGAGQSRVSWDAPLHATSDLERLPAAGALNLKPSRIGSLRELLRLVDFARERGLAVYGGGQFELGVGREQIQLLAALYYPDGPNDVAPAEFHRPQEARELPRSPLTFGALPDGFRLRASS